MRKEQAGEFWKRVELVLQEKRMKQADLSRLSGIANGTLSSSRRDGNMPLANNAQKIADALGVSLKYLLFGIQDEEPDPEIEEAFASIKKSRRQIKIAKALPSLNNDQISAIECMIQSWGIDPEPPIDENIGYYAGGGGHSKALA